ncbi:MAG: endonuclease [Mogibacterium sp.]|nr:endonuclease [Mogibacterium sp.]
MKHAKEEKKKGGFFRKLFRFIGCVLLLAVLAFGGLIAWLTAAEYSPDETIALETAGEASKTLSKGDSIRMMSWNMGYGALGDNADFFMDGGSGVMTADKARVESNLQGITEEIAKNDPDILFLQEIDENSKRSYNIDETALLKEKLAGYSSAFAYNYKVPFVPYPVPPLGKINSGIMTFSEYPMENCERIQLPISFSWPVRTANLKRCLLVSRIPVSGSSNELVLINLHLEAYDSGEGKIAQTAQLIDFLNEEYKKGNYVIAGGDFNQIFSSAKADLYPAQEGKWAAGIIDVSGAEGSWNFIMDETVPSCRSLDQPYAGADKEGFQYYLIDGFIVSGNIKVNEFKNRDLGFVCSDHNPVTMDITLD